MESYDKPRQHIKKQSHHLADKGPYSQSQGFSSSQIWMWNLDHKKGWVPKNWCFQIVVLGKKLSRASWTAKRSNRSILKEINPEFSLGDWSWSSSTFWKAGSLENILMLGKIEGRRRRGQQRVRWLDGITDSMDMSVWANSGGQLRTGKPGVLHHGVAKGQTWRSD